MTSSRCTTKIRQQKYAFKPDNENFPLYGRYYNKHRLDSTINYLTIVHVIITQVRN